MRLRILPFLSLFTTMFVAGLQAQTKTPIIASALLNVDGSAVTGRLCIYPASLAGGTQGFTFGGTGQGSTAQKCFSVTAGVLQSGVYFPDTSATNPQNLCIFAQLIDPSQPAGRQLVRTWPCLQPSGSSSWSLDTATSSGTSLPLFTGPAGPPGPACSTGSGYCAMTVPVRLPGNPSNVLDAAPKQYVDAAANAAVPIAGGTMIGQLNVPTPYTATTGQYQLSATRGLGGFVTPELYGAYGDGTHDDTAAIQACWNASGTSNLLCRMSPISGTYLVNGQLTTVYGMHVSGNSNTYTVIRSEYNGAAVVMAAGVNIGIVMENLHLVLDPALANSAGFVFTAAPVSGGGGLWYSEFKNIAVSTPAKECLRLDGGGPLGYTFNYPNQQLQFNSFNCTGPTGQAHPANLIEISGQMGQVVFRDGVVNGDPTNTGTGSGTTYTYYPNALILLHPYGGIYGDVSPTNVSFVNMSPQYGQIAYSLQYVANIIINGGGHSEAIGTEVLATDATFTLDDNYFGDVGTTAVVSMSGGTASIKNNSFVWDTGHSVTSLATCTVGGTVFAENNYAGNAYGMLTSISGCSTQYLGAVTATMTTASSETLVQGDGGTTPITTLVSSVTPGNTISLYANSNSFKLTTGGNISFGNFSTPLSIPAGSTVTLRLYDNYGLTWVVESMNGGSSGGSGIANIQITTGTTAVAANTCTTNTATTMAGLLTTSSIVSPAPTSSTAAVTGWGAVGGLSFDYYVTAGTFNWCVKNTTATSITPGGSVTWNVGAR